MIPNLDNCVVLCTPSRKRKASLLFPSIVDHLEPFYDTLLPLANAKARRVELDDLFDELAHPLEKRLKFDKFSAERQLSKEETKQLDVDVEKFWLAVVDVSGFSPDQIKISFNEDSKKISIKAQSDWADEDGTQMSSRTMSRSFLLPVDARADSLKSKMLPTRMLVLLAEKVVAGTRTDKLGDIRGGKEAQCLSNTKEPAGPLKGDNADEKSCNEKERADFPNRE